MKTLTLLVLLVSGIARGEALINNINGNIGLRTGSYVHYTDGTTTQQLGNTVFVTPPFVYEAPVYAPQPEPEAYAPAPVSGWIEGPMIPME